jgi:RNA polymerase subunit RPABC4/transcription elongation factor Spt4
MLDDKRCAECRRLGVGTGACPFCGSASGTVERLSRRARLLS